MTLLINFPGYYSIMRISLFATTSFAKFYPDEFQNILFVFDVVDF